MAEIALAGATAVLRQTVGALSSLVFKEGSGLSQLREDVIWLESEMRHIQSYLEDAEAKQETSRGVANLMIDMRDLAHDVEDIMEKYFPWIASHQRKGFGGFLRSSACVSCYGCAARDFVIEIEGIKRRVENIHRVRQTYGINECSGRRSERDMWDERRSFPHVDEPNVVGFEKHIDNLVAKMRSKELRCRVVSIIGMPGLGKTTLAKKVYKSIQHSFEHSAWIYVSQQANINEILQDIARQVGLEKEKWEENFEANLCTLLSEHRYVIVLDDIWRTDTWDAIKNAIPTNKENGSRIILTSRNRDVGTHVGGLSSLHELPTLNEENSRELFFKMVMNSPQTTNGTSDPPQPQLKSIGEQILKRCGGVPLAIVLTAGLLLLREKSENEWKRILEGMGQDQDQCSEIFALSYKDLPSNLKPCFLYFGLFPEDHEISAFDLVNLWAAEGFIRANGLREVEDVGDDYLNHLQARNLIQVVRRRFDGRVKSCRIHHILHGLCIRVAKEINFFNTHNDTNTYNATLRVRRVTTLGSDFGNYLSLNYQTPKLRAMLCFNGDLENIRSKKDKNFLQGFRFLRVLSVKSDYLSGYLPIEVGNWRHLTYLGLGFKCSHDQFVELPHTISNLRSLLTLDVQECYGVILPHVIWNMKQLRHILLPQYCRARSFYGVKFIPLHLPKISFPNLRTLHGLPGHLFTSDGWRKLTNLRTLRVNFPTKRMIKVLSGATPISRKLEELRLLGNKNCNALNLSRYENLVEVHFQKMWSFELPQHGKMPPNLTKLTLERTYLEEDPIKTLQKLPKLKILKLSNIRYNGNKMVCSGEHGNFPQLQVLKIKGMLYQEFVIEEEGMPRLQEFWIRECRPMTIRIPDRIRNIMITDYQTKRVLASRVQR